MPGDPTSALRSVHLRWGWWTLLAFSASGLLLESLHGLKLGWYLDAGQETRRLMFTLGHAHGTLLALVHLAFAATLAFLPHVPRDASLALRVASIAIPLGFWCGGIVIHEADPNLTVLLVPLGAFALLWSCARIALVLQPSEDASPPRPGDP